MLSRLRLHLRRVTAVHCKFAVKARFSGPGPVMPKPPAAKAGTSQVKTVLGDVDVMQRTPQAFSPENEDLSRMPDLVEDELIESFLNMSRGGTSINLKTAPYLAAPTRSQNQLQPALPLRTVLDVFRYALTRFSQGPDLAFGQSTTDATEEAHLLLTVYLSLPLQATSLFLRDYGKARLTPEEVAALVDLISRRCGVGAAAPIPVSYLLKTCYQQGERFSVDERVLIPRSFIGEMLNPACKHCIFETNSTKRKRSGGKKLPLTLSEVNRVLDLCCGSGALAILAYRLLTEGSVGTGPRFEEREAGQFEWSSEQEVREKPSGSLRIDCADISFDALAVCNTNIVQKGLQHKLFTHQGDCFTALPLSAKYNLVVCNPPYVSSRGMRTLPKEYRAEPALALDGGKEGLDIVRKVLKGASDRLEDGGWLVLEVGLANAGVRKILSSALREGNTTEGVKWLDTANSRGEVVALSKEVLLAVSRYLSSASMT